MQPLERSAYLAAQAREHDPDRFLTALFAPPARREAVLALILLDHELARVPDAVRQPMAGYIRYQWWRDALDEIAAGVPARRHPVAAALAEAVRSGWLAVEPLQALVDAREGELEGLPGENLAALEDHVARTGGLLQELSLAALGGGSPDERAAARRIGTAFGLVGRIRAVAREAASRRQALPSALLREAGVNPSDLAAARISQGLRRVVGAVMDRAEALLASGREAAGKPARALMPAFLPAPLAASYVARVRALGDDPFRAMALARPAGAPLTLLVAWLRRRP